METFLKFLEVPCQGASNEYHNMFSWRYNFLVEKNNALSDAKG